MLLIPCPWCGPRDEAEFRYGGQAGVAYPRDPWALDDGAWAEFLFVRDNPKGWFAERWFHTAGCRRWCHVLRDTLDNRIAASGPAGTQLPEPDTGDVDEPADPATANPARPAPGSRA
ncbi:hypothetical protein CDO52_10670 [Nocardiopsis gilva YIM 90087]|uniref:Sarcosine oxidase subunit delta n=1 Tax=Nocardiopsis gilva YIM 90087 TaxID=1235441 RepID=A0A223S4Z7_9ACTN|nr:sarcosine oxidase subunit delta [Nocardiopsis gilva]ASU83181.1 hypothetical protein CDO52_10670 [Nocardiopsis gilva YIM 90087]